MLAALTRSTGNHARPELKPIEIMKLARLRWELDHQLVQELPTVLPP